MKEWEGGREGGRKGGRREGKERRRLCFTSRVNISSAELEATNTRASLGHSEVLAKQKVMTNDPPGWCTMP